MQIYKQREEIPTEFKWDVQSIFASDQDWEQAYQAIQQRIPELAALQGTLNRDGAALLRVLQTSDEIAEPLERLSSYSSMRKDEDTANSQYQSMRDRAIQLIVQASTAASYIEPE